MNFFVSDKIRNIFLNLIDRQKDILRENKTDHYIYSAVVCLYLLF